MLLVLLDGSISDLVEIVSAFGAEGNWFDSTSSRHVGTLDKSLPVIACMTDVASCGLALNSISVV